MRVVLDTNVIVSAILSPTGAPARLVGFWQTQVFGLVVSEDLLQEYLRALSYPHVAVRHGMNATEASQIVEDFRQFSDNVNPDAMPRVVLEDPDDDKVLACAVAGGADFLVSGDTHLLRLEEYQGVRILTPAAFLMLLQEDTDDRRSRT